MSMTEKQSEPKAGGPTPRTDDQVRRTHQGVGLVEVVQSEFARTLERELNGKAKYLGQSGDNEERLLAHIEKLTKDLKKALETIDALNQAAIDEMI